MQKIKVNLQNCYGIKKLENEFEFSHSKKTYAIYAPNGIMKTSLANTFLNFTKDEESKDLIFKERISIREIKDENDVEIKKEKIFVIESYNEKFSFEKVSTLLANNDLKLKYDEIHKKINIAKDNLLKKLKQLSGIKNNIEEEISKKFAKKDFFDVIENIEATVTKEEKPKFASITYISIFNDKAYDFFMTKDFKNQIKAYIEKYNELLNKSKFLKQGFDHYKASTIQKNLKDNGFFRAQHSINLNDGMSKQEITKEDEFEKLIQEEKNKILYDKDLLKKWNEIDEKLSKHNDLRSLRDYLFDNKEILSELENIDKFAMEIWLSYFIEQKELYEILLIEYKKGKIEIEQIVKKSKEQTTTWTKVIDEFNRRFFVPFKLEIENQDDVILKDNVPSVKFIFENSGEKSKIEKDNLLKVLSSGEKRALYILNIIFEVEARKKNNQETLFIVDDIADSFDYKNKYAIIQYLKDISENVIFHQIILTHNFDFFRTIESRKVVNYTNCLFAYKNENNIKLEKASNIKNPFINDWKNNLADNKKLIASIPFVRNIIEYTKGKNHDDYINFTSLLHWKSDSNCFSMSKYKEIYEKTFAAADFPTKNLNDNVIDIIFNEADNCLTTSEGINLENKIILSIAIRLKAEKFLIDQINDSMFVSAIKSNQTFELSKKYKNTFPSKSEDHKILDEINLMTPENIHLNSFMYEPILDMSDQHLKDLYIKTKNLN